MFRAKVLRKTRKMKRTAFRSRPIHRWVVSLCTRILSQYELCCIWAFGTYCQFVQFLQLSFSQLVGRLVGYIIVEGMNNEQQLENISPTHNSNGISSGKKCPFIDADAVRYGFVTTYIYYISWSLNPYHLPPMDAF